MANTAPFACAIALVVRAVRQPWSAYATLSVSYARLRLRVRVQDATWVERRPHRTQ
ncbi:hypothetical protein [Microbacterium lacticum]